MHRGWSWFISPGLKLLYTVIYWYNLTYTYSSLSFTTTLVQWCSIDWYFSLFHEADERWKTWTKAIASLKLTFSHLKMDGWKTILSFWDGTTWQVRTISFREDSTKPGPEPFPSTLLSLLQGRALLSSVIYFRHNDMQDRVVKLGKWHRTAVAEARGRFFVFFFGGSSRKQMLCNHFLHIIHSLDISFLPLNILAMRSCPFRKYRTCMLKETSISL